MPNIKTTDLNIWMMGLLNHNFEKESESLSSNYKIGELKNHFYWEIILSKFNSYSQLNFWDENVADQIYIMMKKLFEDRSETTDLEPGFQYLILSIEELFSSATAFSLVQKYDGPEEIRVNTLLLPDIAQLLNGPFSNLLKFLMYPLQMWLDTQKIDKNILLQNKNKAMMGLLSKYYGNEIFSDIIDGNIRNALSHGGYRVINDGKYITFYYSEEHRPCSMNIAGATLNDESYKTLDVIAGMIIGIIRFLVELEESDQLFENETPIVSDFKNRLKLSTNQLDCVYVGKEPGYDDLIQVSVKSKKNVSQNIVSTWAINFLAKTRIMLPNQNRYMFNFKMPNALSAWGQVFGDTLDLYIENKITAQNVLDEMASDRDDHEIFVQYPINANVESGVRLLFNPYEPIELDGIDVEYIRDISVEGAKRFACRAFIDSANIQNVKLSAEKIIDSISKLPNYQKPEYEVKNGLMEADIILIDFFRKDRATRHDAAFVKSSQNSNYIGTCESYKDGFRDQMTNIFDVADWQNLRKQNSNANRLWLWNKNVSKH
ncbi:hypothetical protein [Lactiplantibacillus paraplantarum]|uniref:hypothetical protein n=1 Tax=Lactiplantibacillus paraplantarum TaxID=60520 RepID=UPI0023AB3C4C|nr:hypothetical protein [Lactiplantibacillus paraplantarum]WEE35633.1 hypothetical protein PWO93_13180 [Lactiplantibacillus paraplantarum]